MPPPARQGRQSLSRVQPAIPLHLSQKKPRPTIDPSLQKPAQAQDPTPALAASPDGPLKQKPGTPASISNSTTTSTSTSTSTTDPPPLRTNGHAAQPSPATASSANLDRRLEFETQQDSARQPSPPPLPAPPPPAAAQHDSSPSPVAVNGHSSHHSSSAAAPPPLTLPHTPLANPVEMPSLPASSNARPMYPSKDDSQSSSPATIPHNLSSQPQSQPQPQPQLHLHSRPHSHPHPPPFPQHPNHPQFYYANAHAYHPSEPFTTSAPPPTIIPNQLYASPSVAPDFYTSTPPSNYSQIPPFQHQPHHQPHHQPRQHMPMRRPDEPQLHQRRAMQPPHTPAPLPDDYSSSSVPAGPIPASSPSFHPHSSDLHSPQPLPSQHISHSSSSNIPHFTPHNPPGQQASPQQPSSFNPHANDAAELTRFVRSHFGQRDFADCVVHLSHAARLFHPTSIPCHAIFLSRSPKLRSLMAMQHGNSMHPQAMIKSLNLSVGDSFLGNADALVAALMHLYGAPVPPAASRPFPAPQDEREPQHQMRAALAYAASGHFLQLESIVSAGLDLAASQLRWYTLDIALAFALDGGLGPSWSANDSQDRGSSSSLDDTALKLDSPTSAPAYGYYSDRILHACLSFIVSNVPASFRLYASAPQLPDLPRLPAAAEPAHTRQNSRRLSHIRFGDVPSEQRPSEACEPVSLAVSSTLLSLPFATLKHVLESPGLMKRLGLSAIADLARSVVDERETRRRRAASNRAMPAPATPAEERAWYAVPWVESVEVDDKAGSVRVARHKLGTETPTSGSAKSQ